ncbi:CDP-alcohol phosphatidyltransferase-domain-containing protein [Aspergillus pseudonomiae]|uniref:CDP-diacylglycerol--inositol 3-phosphatidyltransferase n=1 Tax=Aspergillus pseudonomiae TaxID=1506151 RepID=A0A5N6HUR8_9EURO|nr:CDP-alcohol phosphatidyltransferase-domain-containing protein [Aspergillus pseudonomiae]KAB8258232.1 CDP-alcohol phosphatidyltransferase-domain-containing protein [Aspergillus pseudonomiae]KAE8404019.1 CDP-alcohol phosphatidyltransferase-domain-containing protein [Aspergillus pseudonomiae]
MASQSAQGNAGRHKDHDENVFLFVPNLIGYTRVVLAVTSLYYMPLHPRTCSLLYSASCLLDALDGAAARRLGQSTRFGAVLDMITDRCTTTCLLVFLASAFPRWSIVFQGLISLDYSSHYIHMYATLAMGGNRQSHKQIDDSRPWVMRTYYSNTKVLFTVCALNELFFIALYLLSFSSSPSSVNNPNFTASQSDPSMPWSSSWSAGAMEVARANKIDDSVPWCLLHISTPFMLFKQYVNMIQLTEASKWLVEGDIETRRNERLAQKRDQ